MLGDAICARPATSKVSRLSLSGGGEFKLRQGYPSVRPKKDERRQIQAEPTPFLRTRTRYYFITSSFGVLGCANFCHSREQSLHTAPDFGGCS